MTNPDIPTGLSSRAYGIAVNWDDIPAEDVRPGVRKRVYSTDSVMIAWHSLEVGMQINPHVHADFDQLVYIESGICDYYVAGTPNRMGPGSLLLVPAGAEHYIVPVVGPCINLDIFSPPRADFLSSVHDMGAPAQG